jgi:DNA/RNA-binding domain of Phe-tRNA-synthetase-like protein
MLRVDNTLHGRGLRLGVVVIRGVSVAPSTGHLRSELDSLISLRATEDFPPPPIKDAVRQMLRQGGFKPSGRSKPASEYLAQAAREKRFPVINDLVDLNNWFSLRTGWPVSLLDLRAVRGHAIARLGASDEKYVFNSAGHEIDLGGLICICRANEGEGVPLGNPVKDSMEGKIKDDSRDVAYFVYAPEASVSEEYLRSELQAFVKLAESLPTTEITIALY